MQQVMNFPRVGNLSKPTTCTLPLRASLYKVNIEKGGIENAFFEDRDYTFRIPYP